MSDNKEKLYNIQIGNFVLGSLMKNPALFLQDQYPLSKNDFIPHIIHKTVFVCISNLALKGFKLITSVDIAEYIKNYPSAENLLIDGLPNGDYISYLNTLPIVSNDKGYEYYYEELRKYSCLRDYREMGFDISELYDLDKSEESQSKNLSKYSLKQVIDYFEVKQSKIRREYNSKGNVTDYKAGSDFLNTIEDIKQGGLVGGSFQSEYQNEIFNGEYGFIFRSGKTGDGKTVAMVGDTIFSSATHIWDSEQNKFIENELFSGGALFINTEMDLKKELDIMFIACIADIERCFIREWDLTEEEIERVYQAQKILESSPIYVVDDPEFTIGSLTEKVTEYVLTKDIINVYFDYLALNGYLDSEMRKEADGMLRGDEILLKATDRLKFLQRSLDIFLESSSQLNGKEDELAYPTEAVLAAGKSQTRKLDGAMVLLPITKKEIEVFKLYVPKIRGFNQSINMEELSVTHIIKGRNSKYPKYIKIFSMLNKGTCRNTDYVCLTKDNLPVKDRKGNNIKGRVIKKGNRNGD
ncbi:MAG: DnaB-like helicase C-terminal domain-containing protein [Bacilli bacterium]